LLEPQAALALVIGANEGVHPSVARLPRLSAAERSAGQVARELTRMRPFRRADVRLLQHPQVADVTRVFEDLTRRVEQLRAQGQHGILFVLHYVGHGYGPDLALRDGPLVGKDLERLLSNVDADFTVAVLDRCRDERRMGVQPVPRAKLSPVAPPTRRAGVVLYATEPFQSAYEIEGRVLFTAAWLEALRRGPAFTLQEVWQHARRRTRSMADEYQVQQSPTAVPPLKEKPDWGAVVLRVPSPRSAQLELGPGVAGPVELVYSPAYSEGLSKAAGRRQRWDIHPGTFRLQLPETSAGPTPTDGSLPHVVKPGQRLVVEDAERAPARPWPGERTVRSSLGTADPGLRSVVFEAGSTANIGLAQRLTDRAQLLPRHSVGADLRLDHGRWSLGAEVGYGFDRHVYEGWSSTLQALVLRAYGGRSAIVGGWHLLAGPELGATRLWQHLEPEAERTAWALQPGARVSLQAPLGVGMQVGGLIAGGAAWAPGVAPSSKQGWGWYASAGLVVHARVP